MLPSRCAVFPSIKWRLGWTPVILPYLPTALSSISLSPLKLPLYFVFTPFYHLQCLLALPSLVLYSANSRWNSALQNKPSLSRFLSLCCFHPFLFSCSASACAFLTELLISNEKMLILISAWEDWSCVCKEEHVLHSSSCKCIISVSCCTSLNWPVENIHASLQLLPLHVGE